MYITESFECALSLRESTRRIFMQEKLRSRSVKRERNQYKIEERKCFHDDDKLGYLEKVS